MSIVGNLSVFDNRLNSTYHEFVVPDSDVEMVLDFLTEYFKGEE